MKILIKNCTLISMAEKTDKIEENRDILINENKIEKIGKNIQVSVDKIIDGTGKVVMPGLINTHSHIAMSIFRETLDGCDLQEWLEKKIWPMEKRLTEKDTYFSSLLSCIEMIKTGTTTVNNMYFLKDETIKAALDSGIRLQTTRTLIETNDDGKKAQEELEKLIIDMIDKE